MTQVDLFLWRHAEAEDGVPDLERRLTAKGRRDAATVSKALAQHARQARVIASPARRTRETADALTERTDRAAEIEPRIAPGADVDDVLAVIDAAIAAAQAERPGLILVGHQPWVGQTARHLLSGRADDWSVKKASAWWLVRRSRNGETEWTLRTVLDPDLL